MAGKRSAEIQEQLSANRSVAEYNCLALLLNSADLPSMGYSSGGKHSNKNKDNALSEAVTMRLVGLNVYSTSYVPMDLKSEAEVTKVVNDLAVMNYCSNEAGLHWERQN